VVDRVVLVTGAAVQIPGKPGVDSFVAMHSAAADIPDPNPKTDGEKGDIQSLLHGETCDPERKLARCRTQRRGRG
jgi:hypothetical protein